MEVFLYNSTVCRLCGEENDSGTLLYSNEDNNQNLCEIINTFLPIKVSDDGQLPRTICPGCTIQLEATVEFLNLIIKGQKILRQLHEREVDYKSTINGTLEEPQVITENILYEINTKDGVYHMEHPISLQVSGQEKPRRKRGRPPKKTKTPEQIAEENTTRDLELAAKKETCTKAEVSGKRRRKTPTRFKEAVQGKELERIFKEEGVIDAEDSDPDVKGDVIGDAKPTVKEPEIIGHLETSGELVVVIKGKGRGRPKGRMRPTREKCAICGMEFSCVGRYMSHVAQHGPVLYQCAPCAATFPTRLDFRAHQDDSGHSGQLVFPCSGDDRPLAKMEVKIEPPTTAQEQDPLQINSEDASGPMKSLPILVPDVETQNKEQINTTEFLKSLVNEKLGTTSYMDPSPSENNSQISEKTAPAETTEEVVEVTGPKGKVKLKCPHCEKLFSSKQSKSLHIKAVHKGEKPYACAECGCKFAYPRSLALHAVSHRRGRAAAKRYACDLCGKVLNHPSSVVYHKEAEHAGQRYVCNKCGKCFKHKQLLQRHQLVHSQVRPYSCKTCSSTFKTKANLINHQLLHSGVKKFSCEICKSKFAHKTSLTLHMRWHTGLKPFVCNICNKSFSQKGNLSEHERIHTGEKPYECALCPRRFTTSSQYRLHARRHLPERPRACANYPKRAAAHACAVCGRAFAERWALLKHARRHTGERPFRCPHCPRAFADCSNLNKHRKQVHKQISLLVTDKNKQPVVEQKQLESKLVLQPAEESELHERVIYVTYDESDPEPAFQILEQEQGEALEEDKLSACELYSSPPLLVSPPGLHELAEQQLKVEAALQHGAGHLADHLVLDPDHQISVTDEDGNPLHFTMQDGTRLAITSADGKSLQVVTEDGQTIPVEINGYGEEEEGEEEGEEGEQEVHQLALHKDDANVTHFYTIV